LRWSQTVIDLAEGDPAKGDTFGVGSPLAVALVWRGVARWWLGLKGWRRDLDDAVAMARCSDPATHAMVVTWKYVWAIPYGVLLADNAAVHEIDEAMQAAEGSSDDTALTAVKFVLGSALVQRDGKEVQRGQRLVAQVRETCIREQFFLQIVPMIDLYTAGERARRGDPDGVVPVMQKIVGDLFARGQFGHFVMANSFLVETLLNRGTEGDVVEAEEAIDRLANLPVAVEWAVSDILLLRLQALLARAHGDATAYAHFRDRYRDMAKTLGYEGHMAWAEAMP
jgi:hypothetical protein